MRLVFQKLGFDPDRDMDVVLIENEGISEKVAAIKDGKSDFLFYHHNGPQGRVVRELIRDGELEEVDRSFNPLSFLCRPLDGDQLDK